MVSYLLIGRMHMIAWIVAREGLPDVGTTVPGL